LNSTTEISTGIVSSVQLWAKETGYCRAQVTELKYICLMPLRRTNHFWI